MCLMIDEMEHLEGVPYYGAPNPPEQEYFDEDEEEVVVVDEMGR